MRKVTANTVYAFLRRERAACGNTMTDGEALYLHGNEIAWWDSGGLFLTLAGWPTATTRERLNGLCQAAWDLGFASGRFGFYQRDHEQYFQDDNITPYSVVQIA